jgi:hydroxypyruvate isomerase
MDIYHCQNVEGDVATELRKYLALPRQSAVGHIQIAGVPGRHEPDTGDLNYDPLFDLIEELDFKGWIGLEYNPKAGTSDGLKWLRNRTANSLKPAL